MSIKNWCSHLQERIFFFTWFSRVDKNNPLVSNGMCSVRNTKWKRRRWGWEREKTVLLQPISKCNLDISYFRAEGKPEGWWQREATENDKEREMKDWKLHQEREITRNKGTESEREGYRTEVGIRMLSVGYYECKWERQCHGTVTHRYTLTGGENLFQNWVSQEERAMDKLASEYN